MATTVQPWLRLQRAVLANPKFMRLSLTLRGVLLTALAATDDDGRLPELDDMVFYLGVGETECRAMLDELLSRKWLIGEILAGEARYRFKGWAIHQKPSDSSANRVRRFREKHRSDTPPVTDVTVTVTAPKRLREDSDSDKNIKLVPSEYDAVRAKSAREQGKNFGLKGKGSGRQIPEALIKRAEGLGVPVDEILATVDARKPENPRAYFRTLAVNRLQPKVPAIRESVIADALEGKREPYTIVTAALMAVQS